MKIGILTFHFITNYGSYLQAYSLAKAIEQLGHQVEIIDYRNPIHYRSIQFHPWVYRRPLRLWHDFRKHRTFNRMAGRLPLSPPATHPVQVDWNAYDAIVVGSDTVWNYEFPGFGQDPVFFGQFPAPYRGRLVAYAPSIGSMQWNYAAPPWVAEGLRQFHFVGVRDSHTANFVERQIGVKPPLVVDPTWLFDKIAAPQPYVRRTSREFLLVYSFLLKGRPVDEIKTFARKQGLLTVAVGYWQGWCQRNWADVDTFEWVQLFQQAKYVISGTFHGTLYSIREQVPFCLLANEGSDNKTNTALSLAGLQDRHTADPRAIAQILLQPIDYTTIKGKLDRHRRQSLSLLKQALS